MKTRIHFVINPISGSGKNGFLVNYIEHEFNDNKYELSIDTTNYKGHAAFLVKKAIKEQTDIVVACGGDGTINEVASCLVGTNIPLGIIPLGSGNGLASNLNISKKIEKALSTIKNGIVTKIDVGQINSTYFFSNTGFGFDSDVIYNYEKISKRSLSSYIRATYTSFKNYSAYEPVYIAINGEKQIVSPFMVFISNSNEMGYNMSLTPKASLSDGLLDIVIIPKIKKHKVFYLLFLFLIKRIDLLKGIKRITAKKISISKGSGTFFKLQKDGEFYTENGDTISISINNKILNVIVP